MRSWSRPRYYFILGFGFGLGQDIVLFSVSVSVSAEILFYSRSRLSVSSEILFYSWFRSQSRPKYYSNLGLSSRSRSRYYFILDFGLGLGRDIVLFRVSALGPDRNIIQFSVCLGPGRERKTFLGRTLSKSNKGTYYQASTFCLSLGCFSLSFS